MKRLLTLFTILGSLVLAPAAAQATPNPYVWYASNCFGTNTYNCWATDTAPDHSISDDNVTNGFFGGYNTVDNSNGNAGGTGDVCVNYAGLPNMGTTPSGWDLSGLTGYEPPNPIGDFQVSDNGSWNPTTCQAQGGSWGYLINGGDGASGWSTDQSGGNGGGLNHTAYLPFADRPWSSMFGTGYNNSCSGGAPCLYLAGSFNGAHDSAGSNPIVPGSDFHAYLCATIYDTSNSQDLKFEYCSEIWRSDGLTDPGNCYPGGADCHYDSQAGFTEWANTGDGGVEVWTRPDPGTRYAKEGSSSSNYIGNNYSGNEYYAEAISLPELETAIADVNTVPNHPVYSTNPDDYALASIQVGVEGNRGPDGTGWIGASSSNLFAETLY